MDEMLSNLPSWAGTVPQWGMFAAIVIAFFKLVPVWRQQTFDHDTQALTAYRKEVGELRTELKSCEEDCAKDVKALHEEIWGMRKQNIAEQISLINVILKTVDAPELKGMLAVFENVQARLAIHEVIRQREEDENAKGA